MHKSRPFPPFLIVLSSLLWFTLSPPVAARSIPYEKPAGVDTLQSLQPDTLISEDTTGVYDAAARVDTLGRLIVPPLAGSLDPAMDSAKVLSPARFRWLEYRFAGDILAYLPGAFLRDQNSEGQYSALTFRGHDWRNVAVLSNGRLLNEPSSGLFNLHQLAPEDLARIEVETGPRAFLYGLNSTGGAVNAVTLHPSTNVPLSRIRYSESAEDYSIVDGLFSQNISRRVNVTLGFQHQGTDGRFSNSTYDGWNVRSRVRSSFSPHFHMILSGTLVRSETDLNGGIDTLSIDRGLAFEPIQARVFNTDSYEKVRRNDLDVSFVGTFLGDSSGISLLTLYYSDNLREYRDEENRSSPNGIFIQSDHSSSWRGVQFRQQYHPGPHRLMLGANAELRKVESPDIGLQRNVINSVWAKYELDVATHATVAAFWRNDRYLGVNYDGYGADAKVRLPGGVSLFGGVSWSSRVPTYTELYWSDTTFTRRGTIGAERHRLIEAGVDVTSGRASARAAVFHRTTTSPLRPSPAAGRVLPGAELFHAGRMTTTGIEAGASVQIGWFLAEGSGMYLRQRLEDETLKDYPEISARGGVFYRNLLLNDNLDLKVGLQGRYLSSHRGALFNPEVLLYVPSERRTLGQGGSFDFVLIGRFGDAYLHLLWENLADNRYFTTPFYPVRARAVRFGLTWELLN